MSLKPLQHSWAATELEAELRALAIKLYSDHLQARAEDINVYGAPHLGSFGLVERGIASDGLAVMRQTDEAGIRYLFKAWRHRNPQRGFHFLRMYLRVVFGEVSNIQQMWQPKSATYPQGIKSESEILAAGESIDDYFLTSRVTVDIDTEEVPSRIVRSLTSTVPARIVFDVRLAKFQQSTLLLGGHVSAGVLCFGSGNAVSSGYLMGSGGELLTDQTDNFLTGQ